MQNKPNFGNDKMSITLNMTSIYKILSRSPGTKNKANSNPIQTQSKPIKANFNAKQSQTKPKQTQFQDEKHSANILIGWRAVQLLMCSICILQAAHSVRTFFVGDVSRAFFKLSEIFDDKS